MKIKALLSNDSICWKGLCHEDIIQCRFGSIFKVVKSLLSTFTRTRNAPVAL